MLAVMDARMQTEQQSSVQGSADGMGADGGAGRPDGPGVPDDVERLWMPHRMAYIKGENKPESTEAGDGCPFCRVPTLSDEQGLIVERGKLVYAVLNLYPYSPGHLLICPYRHIADYAQRGKSFVVVSSESPELLGICHRVLVMYEGRVAAVLDAGEATQELIAHYSVQRAEEAADE